MAEPTPVPVPAADQEQGPWSQFQSPTPTQPVQAAPAEEQGPWSQFQAPQQTEHTDEIPTPAPSAPATGEAVGAVFGLGKGAWDLNKYRGNNWKLAEDETPYGVQKYLNKQLKVPSETGVHIPRGTISLVDLGKATGLDTRTMQEVQAALAKAKGTEGTMEPIIEMVQGVPVQTGTRMVGGTPPIDLSPYVKVGTLEKNAPALNDFLVKNYKPIAAIEKRVVAPATAGISAAEGQAAFNRAKEGRPIAAGLDVAGAIGAPIAAAKFLPKKLRVLGGLAAATAPIVDVATEPAKHAAGGSIQNFAKGQIVEDIAKKLFTPRETQIVRASEALAPHEGKYLHLTQSDRMRSTEGDLGGPGFSKFQLERPEYAEAQAAWGVGKKPTASGIVNVNKKFGDQAIWTPMIGSETQHHSNQHVYDVLADEFNRQASLGKLTPELQERINSRLMTRPEYQNLFPEDFDIANPEHLAQYGNTFDRRGALSTLMSGQGVGGTKGRIIDYPDIMQQMTDPMTVGAPTHSLGTRLFSLTGDVDYRPDLHSAFPYILKGEDKGVAFSPVPKELGIPDFINQFKEFKGREPGYYDLTRTIPHQQITEDYLRGLEEAGHAAGGSIVKAAKELILPAAENAARTQIIGTLPTYAKAADILAQRGAKGQAIDFGAGLGKGAAALGEDTHTYEPFAKDWTPTFTKPEDIPTDAYGRLTNLNVLNVVPREARDEIVQHIGRVMEPGGLGILTTRGADVMGAKGTAGPEPMSIITSRDTYQKGFTKQELEDYMKYMLGDKFDVNKLNLGPAGVLIQKKAAGGEILKKLLPLAEREANKTKFLENSVVKDPLYHGTFKDFNAFDKNKRELGFHLGNPNQASYIIEDAAKNPFFGSTGANVMPVHASIKKPYEAQTDLGDWSSVQNWKDYLKQWELEDSGILNLSKKDIDSLRTEDDIRNLFTKKGYDSIEYPNHMESASPDAHLTGDYDKSYMVFEPTQIKSAIGNEGTFDPTNPDITKKRGGLV